MNTSRWHYPTNCSECQQPTGRGRAKGMCQSCYGKQTKARHKADPILLQRVRDSQNRSHARHRQTRNQRTADRNRQIRIQVIEGLGGKCVCCGETERICLCLVHIKGGGRREYQKLGSSAMICKLALKEGLPTDKYRVLCWNCNAALGLWGYCPHSQLTAPVFQQTSIPSLSHRMV